MKRLISSSFVVFFPSFPIHPILLSLTFSFLGVFPSAAAAQRLSFEGIQTTVPVGGLGQPAGIAVNGKGDLFIADPANHRVVELAAGGATQTTVGSGLVSPTGVAVNGLGDLYIADRGLNRVVRVPWESGDNYGAPTAVGGGFANPVGVAVEAAGGGSLGTAFIADSSLSSLVQASWTGGANYGPPTYIGNGLDHPSGVAVYRGDTGFVAVVLSGNRVVALDSGQTVLPFSGLRNPGGVAADAAGDIFVADSGNNRIVELPADGGAQITLPFAGLKDPTGVAVDADRNVFALDSGNARVVEWQPAAVNFRGIDLCAAGQSAPPPCSETLSLIYKVTASGMLESPKVVTQGAPGLDYTLAASSCSGAVAAGASCSVEVKFAPLFAGSRAGAVRIAAAGGETAATTLLYGFGVGPQIGFNPGTLLPISATGLSGPGQMALDGFGNLFIADSGHGRVLEMPAGGGAGTAVPVLGLVYPTGLAIDGAGNLFIADQSNNQIVELPADGGSQTTLPLKNLNSPTTVAVDGTGNLFVVDQFNNQIVELSAAGAQRTVIGGLNQPFAIAADGAGNLFLADFNLNVLEAASQDGSQQASLFSLTGGAPVEFAADGAGSLFVPELSNALVSEFPANSAGPIVAANGFDHPSAVALDAAGNLYMNSQLNGTVVEAPRSEPPLLQFGAIPFGGTATLPLIVANTGTGTLAIAPQLNGPSYRVASSSPPACLAGIPAGRECTLTIEFSPAAVGWHNDGLTLRANAVRNPVVRLTGAATGVGIEKETPLDFGAVAVGASAVLPLTVVDRGVAGAIQVAATVNGPEYQVLANAQNTCQAGITAGQSCILPVEFSPTAAGTYQRTLTLTSAASPASTVQLRGTATAP